MIFVFQLRLGMSTDPRVQGKALLPVLVDQLFSNVLYAVGVSFALTAVTVLAGGTEPQDKHGELIGLDPWVSAAVAALAVHLLAVISMCLKRTRRAYAELKQ